MSHRAHAITLVSRTEAREPPPLATSAAVAPEQQAAPPPSGTRIFRAATTGNTEIVCESRHEVEVRTLLTFAAKAGASDVHLTAGQPPSLRINGVIHRIKMKSLAAEDVCALLTSIMTPEQQSDVAQGLESDFCYAVPDVGRFRVNVFADRCGMAGVLRLIPFVIPSIDSLGLPPAAAKMCERDSGLVLVTGPTGSGKSTTLAALVGSINATYPGRIITIEDPIEFVHPSMKSVVSQRELGAHTKSFHNALRAALREDPDVILVGEMRDLETIGLAITAAETGHLVFSTLHSPSASQTIDRMIDVFPPGQQGQVRAQLADCLAGVMTQRLLPKTGGGRVAAIEVLLGTPAVRALIREGKSHQLASIMQVGVKDGMKTMEAAITELLDRRLISMADALPLLPPGYVPR